MRRPGQGAVVEKRIGAVGTSAPLRVTIPTQHVQVQSPAVPAA